MTTLLLFYFLSTHKVFSLRNIIFSKELNFSKAIKFFYSLTPIKPLLHSFHRMHFGQKENLKIFPQRYIGLKMSIYGETISVIEEETLIYGQIKANK